MSYIKQDEGGGGDTYTLRAAQSGADVDIQLDAATGSDSDVKLKAGTNITLTEASDTITIDAASGGSPGGSNTQVQFNDGGSFGGDDAFTYDKTNDRVKIGNATIEADNTAKLHVVGTDAALTVERHDDGSSAGPTLNLFRHSDSPADGDDIGQVNFRGEADNGDNITYASIKAEIEDVTTASKDGRLTLRTITNSTQTDAIVIDTKINSEVDHNFKGLIQVNGAAGTAGQVLTSQGSGSDPIWAAAGGGGGGADNPTRNIGYIEADIVGKSGLTGTNSYQLGMAGVGVTNGTPTAGLGTSTALMIPYVVPITGTASMQYAFRTGSTAGDTLAIGFYASDSDGMPNGTPFHSTSFTPTTFTTFTFNTGTTLAKGDLIWFTYFGQSNPTTLSLMTSGGGTFNMLPQIGSSLTYLAKQRQALKNTFSAAYTFDSLSQSTVYDSTDQVTLIPRIAMSFT